MKPTIATIVRTALLVIALANLVCSSLGIIPEEVVSNEQAYKIGSVAVTVVISLINAWKNNSFTTNAIKADAYLQELKNGTATTISSDSESTEDE